ncbi:MAG: hypothetical protein JJT96_15690 [Opitutales bacterium]|nr:hypothetical protein [Opitutales bacterium]
MPIVTDNPKKFLGITLDAEIVAQVKEAAALQAAQRHSSAKVSAYLNELLHKVMPAELERLKKKAD